MYREEGKNMYKKRSGQTYYTNRHSCFLLQYHIVLVTKYRRPVLTGPVKDLVYQVIQDIFDEKKLVILEMNGEADHIHILFEADPFTDPGTLVNIIKTKAVMPEKNMVRHYLRNTTGNHCFGVTVTL